MAHFFTIVFAVLALLSFALTGLFFLGIIFSRQRKNMAVASLFFGFVGLGFLILFGVVKPSQPDSHNAGSAPASAQATAQKPAYDAAALVAQAQEAFKAKDYEEAENLLSHLHTSDLNQPQTHALFNSTTKLADRRRSEEEASSRVKYAQTYESNLLGAGMDATVRAQGPGKKTLYVSMPLMSRPLVYQIMNPNAQADSDLAQGHVWRSITDDRTDLPAVWRSQGFERVVLTDGYDSTWTYKLN